jgi:hypothetical protein
MKKHITEGLPERKHAPAAAGAAPAGKGPAGRADGGEDKGKGGKGEKSPEQRVKQAVYDIRYRARREELPLPQAFSQYMQNSSMSSQERTMVKQKLFGKGGMKAEDFNMQDAATTNVANALFRVFVEGVKEDEPIRLTYMEKLETIKNKKYLVRVEDKNGRGYTRRADREKISQLRANPNIVRIEIVSTNPNKKTAYGDPYEGEVRRGEQTAAAKAGKDYDGDGEVESGAKEYRGAVHNAIQRKKGGTPDGQDTSNVKEAFLADGNEESLNPDANEPEIDVMKGKNIVKINPEVPGSGNKARSFQYAHYEVEGEMIAENGYSKFLKKVHSLQEKAVSQNQQQLAGMALAYLRGEMPDASEEVKKMAKMGEKKLRDFAKTKHKGLPEKVKEEMECGSDDDKKKEIDPRQLKTIKSRMTTTLGLMGIKASYEPEGEVVSEEESDNEKDTGREERFGAGRGVTRDSRGRVIMRNPNYRPSQDPRMGGGNNRPTRKRYGR